MDETLEQEQPEFYLIIPEFNSQGRLCNYHTGENATVRVMADEWERFNQLAGRQHEIVNDVVFFNADLEPCLPDAEEIADDAALFKQEIEEMKDIIDFLLFK